MRNRDQPSAGVAAEVRDPAVVGSRSLSTSSRNRATARRSAYLDYRLDQRHGRGKRRSRNSLATTWKKGPGPKGLGPFPIFNYSIYDYMANPLTLARVDRRESAFLTRSDSVL